MGVCTFIVSDTSKTYFDLGKLFFYFRKGGLGSFPVKSNAPCLGLHLMGQQQCRQRLRHAVK